MPYQLMRGAVFRRPSVGLITLQRNVYCLTLNYQFEQHYVSRFIFGSSCEGTTTPGLNSDTDYLFCYNDAVVVDNIRDAVGRHSYLMIRDKYTKPGYVKLQSIYNGLIKTIQTHAIDCDEEPDRKGRICLKHRSGIGDDEHFQERNGPADTDVKGNSDHVISIRCSKIPEFSTEWKVRKRLYKWPSNQLLDKMFTMGCFFVGVGHSASIDKTLEWRLSFSLQERELMFSMNIVQHKCYILLKLIKKDIMEPVIENAISSYHLKTCMLYVIENTKPKLWKRNNLAYCVFLCLHVLYKWVIEGYCPNYFIKEENMFDRELHRTQKEHIAKCFIDLLSNGCKLLFQIKRDFIGDMLQRGEKNIQMEYALRRSKLLIKHWTVRATMKCNLKLCSKLSKIHNHIEYLHKIHIYLSQTKNMKDHREQHTHEAFSYILPYVHLQLAQSYASLAFSIDELDAKTRLMQTHKYHLDQGRHCDMTSSRLLEVTILYKLEQYEQCIPILNQLEQELNLKPQSVCRCDTKRLIFISHENHKTLCDLNLASMVRRTSTCMIFYFSNSTIIPEALQYEICRSVNTQHWSRRWNYDRWMDLAVVDPEVYLHFMKYLVYSNLNQCIRKHLAINKLESILSNELDIVLYHRETGYNLLGWIHFKEGWIQQGIKCFLKSWSIRPHHNAAKLHMQKMFEGGLYQT